MPEQYSNIKIVLVTEYFPPETGAGSNRAFEHCRFWSRKGAIVTVITGFPDYPSGIIPPKYRGRILYKENIEGINVIRTFTIAAPNRGFIRRVISFISFMISSIVQGSLLVGTQNVIIATSPPFFVGISGYIISKLKNIPFIFEVRDLWPESIIQLGQLKNKVIIKILEWIELKLYQKSVRIISVTDSYVNFIHKKGIPKEKISVVKNGVNLEQFKPQPTNEELKRDMNLEGKFVVAYIGTFGLSHALDKIITTAHSLNEYREIAFLFIGDGAEKANLISQAKNLNLRNITFIPSVPKEQLGSYYSICDILLVPLRKLSLFKTVIPSKIFEIMAMRKPIIISVEGEAQKIIEEANSGFFSEPENPVLLKEKILYAYKNPKILLEMANNGRKYVEENFDRSKIADEYKKIIGDVI